MINNLNLGEDFVNAAGLDTVEVSRSAVRGKGIGAAGLDTLISVPLSARGGGIDT